jgi:hypothetical protein
MHTRTQVGFYEHEINRASKLDRKAVVLCVRNRALKGSCLKTANAFRADAFCCGFNFASAFRNEGVVLKT